MKNRSYSNGHGNSFSNGPESAWVSESIKQAREMSTTFWDLI